MFAVIVLTFLYPLFVSAFSDTIPIVTWSSHSSNILDLLPSSLSQSHHSTALLNAILTHNDICEYDAVVLVNQPGLKASDLRTLPPSSNLVRTILSASSSREFPYVKSSSSVDLSTFGDSISARCGSRLISFTPSHDEVGLESGSKHVICMGMSSVTTDPASRKSAMIEHATKLSSEIDSIASVFPKHLVVFVGSNPTLLKRQVDVTAPSSGNSTLVEGGILKRYQLLTPGLITTLLVTFFVIVPAVLMGINTLASIQSPLRIEAPRGYSAQDRKNK